MHRKNTYILRQLLLALLVFGLGNAIISQGFYNRNGWKKHRHELNFGLGASNFLGEVGGRDRVGTDFVWDLELSKTKFAAQFSYQYYLSERLTFKTSLVYGKLAGDDALTSESFRNNRNLNFETKIYEAGLNLEFHFLKEQLGNIYNLKSSTGKKLGRKSFSLGSYITVGIAGFYFNPYATGSNGQNIFLKPLHTEGQGLPGGPDQYSNFQLAVPIGLGFRKSINRTMGFKIELTHRITFTDYIDDVSTVYYNRNLINQNYGGQAAYYSNPQLGKKPAIVTATGQQRGDPTDNDSYMFLMASFYIKLESKTKFYGRNKVRRVKASF